jgi:exodeoxyribonuclease VII small subunit
VLCCAGFFVKQAFIEKGVNLMVEIKYSKAMKRLDEILQKIEGEEIDVDELADRVKEAVQLIRVCKEKIERAQMEVTKVVDDFEVQDKGKNDA